jgi:hypothetical protein
MSTVDKWLLILGLANTGAILVILVAMRRVGQRLHDLVLKVRSVTK